MPSLCACLTINVVTLQFDNTSCQHDRMKTSKAGASSRRFRGLDGEERQRQRREQLIEAGLNAFGGKGYHSTGVREICAEAKLTERYFYESFRNREALFQAVYEHAIETVRTAVMEAIARSGRAVRTLERTAIRAFLETQIGRAHV